MNGSSGRCRRVSWCVGWRCKRSLLAVPPASKHATLNAAVRLAPDRRCAKDDLQQGSSCRRRDARIARRRGSRPQSGECLRALPVRQQSGRDGRLCRFGRDAAVRSADELASSLPRRCRTVGQTDADYRGQGSATTPRSAFLGPRYPAPPTRVSPCARKQASPAGRSGVPLKERLLDVSVERLAASERTVGAVVSRSRDGQMQRLRAQLCEEGAVQR